MDSRHQFTRDSLRVALKVCQYRSVRRRSQRSCTDLPGVLQYEEPGLMGTVSMGVLRDRSRNPVGEAMPDLIGKQVIAYSSQELCCRLDTLCSHLRLRTDAVSGQDLRTY